jgi:hypothetical protein
VILLGALFAWLLRSVMVDPVPVEVDPIPPDPFQPGTPEPGNTFDYPPPWLPGIEGTQPYLGLGAQPSWDDVYHYAENNYDTTFAAGKNQTGDATAALILNAGRAAIGSTLRAISGFVNQTVEMMQTQFTDLYQTLQFVLGGLDDTNRSQDVKIQHLQQEVAGLATIVAVEEQQIVKLHDTIFQAVEFEGAYLQDWANRTIVEPLLRAIVEEQNARKVEILQASQSVLQQAHTDTLTQLAPVAAAVAVATRAITALQAESANCTQPMCDTMGPNTNLGKLLKGLSLALDAAALADLLSLTAPELADELSQVIAKIAGYIGDFESYFTDGTETIGSVLGGITGGLL